MRSVFRSAVVAACMLVGAAASSSAEPVRGFGRDVPLSSAIRLVVPDGWAVTYGVGVDTHQRVSFSGGEDWRAVVEGLAGRRGLVVSYDVEHRAMRITRRDDPRGGIEDPRRSGRGGFVMSPYNGPRGAEGAAYSSYTDGGDMGAWRADKDMPLRAVLQAWAERSGWSVVWNAGYEYRLQASATFGGDFVQAAGDLVKSLQNAKPAVTATFYKGNRVLVVANDNAGAE